jgi:hypothetical protein
MKDMLKSRKNQKAFLFAGSEGQNHAKNRFFHFNMLLPNTHINIYVLKSRNLPSSFKEGINYADNIRYTPTKFQESLPWI